MAFWNNDQPVRPLPTPTSRSAASASVMLMDAVRSMPSRPACNAVYTALADKKDLSAEDLEALANRIGRLAWERART